ncbi:MAG: hypothetical protein K2Q45_03070 [Nitrosomonas sp.]|nr:hypothetical protein [Nitrosomonas sp.]
MTISQGINKTLAMKKQSGLGVPATGSGGQLIRREKSDLKLAKATHENTEIASHQQSSGITHGSRKATGGLSGLLSPGTYSALLASLLRKAFAATTPITGMSVVIAGSGPTYTISRVSGSYLTDGIKIGDVGRLSAGSLNAANINKNLVVTAASALSITVYPMNGVAMVAQGPITGTTFTVTGKKSLAPLTGQTQEYWTAEEWYSDTSVSRYATDLMIGSADIGLPSTGNATLAFTMAGLDLSMGGSQILTSPTAETTTNVLTAVNGMVLSGGVKVATITGATIKIDTSADAMPGVIGSNVSPDVQRGRIKVSGQITVYHSGNDFSSVYLEGSNTQIVIIAADSNSATADFVSFSIQAVKFSDDSLDDGEKGIVQTLPFTAEMNALGGTSLANDKTIITIQDSQA